MATIDIKKIEQKIRAEKAKSLRYKKAIAMSLNLDAIREWVWEAQESLEDVTYLSQNDDMVTDAFCGDEEEAFEFRVAFESLADDLMQFQEDVDEVWIPDCFDDFFCAVSGKGERFAGYDTVEQDYFGLTDYEIPAAQQEAQKRLEKLTKKDLVDAAHRCFQLAVAYLGLKSRYEDLRTAIDILRAQNDGLLQGIKAIEDLYQKWQDMADYAERFELERKIDHIASQLPQEVWLR